MSFKCLLAVLLTSLVSAGRLPGPEERIVGGFNVDIKNAPYQVVVYVKGVGGAYCGGAIYSERIVLTAAHCLEAKNVARISVRAGSRFRHWGGHLVAVQEAYTHENYDPVKLTNDIGVLYLEAPLNLNTPKIRSIQLTEKDPAAGSNSLVTGWGDTFFGSNSGASMLRGTYLTISDFSYCRHKHNEQVTKDMICAYAPGKDSCQSDSGGPLVSMPDFKLIGIVSWGRTCADRGFPGVYASVYHFREWINNTISKIQKKHNHY